VTSGGTGNNIYTYFVNGVTTTPNSDGSISFPTAGTYSVSLGVSDISGEVANSIDVAVTVNPIPSNLGSVGDTAGGVGSSGSSVPLVTPLNTTTVTTTVPTTTVLPTTTVVPTTTVATTTVAPTPPSSNSSNSGNGGQDHGLGSGIAPSSSAGANWGLAGGLVALVIILLLLYYFYHYHNKEHRRKHHGKK
jgi:hypothetical protein